MSVGYLKKCSNGRTPKQRFETREAAEAFRASMVRGGKWTMSSSNTYRCNQCGMFHAGRIGQVNRGGGRGGGRGRRKGGK